MRERVTDEMVEAALGVLEEEVGIVASAPVSQFVSPGMADDERREGIAALRLADEALSAQAKALVRQALEAALDAPSSEEET